MNICRFEKFTLCLVLAAMLFCVGCATSFVRSGDQDKPAHVFPATRLDAAGFWSVGVKGRPLMVEVDETGKRLRSDAQTRLICGVGAFFDFPLSIAADSLLFPSDLIRLKRAARKTPNENTQPCGLANPAQTGKR